MKRRASVINRVLIIAGFALSLGVEALVAQGVPRPDSVRRDGRGDQSVRRQQMELQLRRGLWRVAKQRIGFTDQQMSQLEQTSRRFDQRRRALMGEEREQRLTLRTEILADSAADQARIASALDQLLRLQRQRVDMHANEQKEFASFMTPLQRARFTTLQEQVRRRLQELARTRAGSSAAAPPVAPL